MKKIRANRWKGLEENIGFMKLQHKMCKNNTDGLSLISLYL